MMTSQISKILPQKFECKRYRYGLVSELEAVGAKQRNIKSSSVPRMGKPQIRAMSAPVGIPQ